MKSVAEVCNPLRYQYLVRVMKRLLHPPMRMLLRSLTRFFFDAPNEVCSTLPVVECPDIAMNSKSMYLYKVTDIEIYEIVNNPENKTSSGIDGINNVLVKLSATVVVRFLKHLINISFAAGIFPKILKYAKV